MIRKKEKSQLEKNISDLLESSEKFILINPDLGLKYLEQANILYNIHGYNSGVECKINKTFRYYMNIHPFN